MEIKLGGWRWRAANMMALPNNRLEVGMNFIEAIKICFTKFVVFEGRASRSEFWWWSLFGALVLIAFAVVGLDWVGDVFGKSGWWQLMWLIPLVGWIVLIYWAVQPSESGDNAFGAPPAA
jgi:uncharacterized membrane protein YhaH (DUF805 family)